MSVIREVDLLDPVFAACLDALMAKLAGTDIQVYETIRSPKRQAEVLAEKRSRSAPYQSAHQYGLGADLVFFPWRWPDKDDPAWSPIREHAPEFGLETLHFERPHVQLRGFDWRAMEPGPLGTDEWLAWLKQRNGGQT
jgi:hypothetical protein